MSINLSKSILDNIARQVEINAEQYEAEMKNDQIQMAEKRSYYLNGISFVLEQIGYIIQYKDNTHVYIDTIENVENRIKHGKRA